MCSLDRPLTVLDMISPIIALPLDQWVMEVMIRLEIPPDAVILDDMPA